ncbi:MAG: glycosyltransferase family 39 protein [Desulfocapsaceae bacterium]
MNQQKKSWNTPQTPSNKFILHCLAPGLLIFSIALLIRLYLTYSIGNSGDEFERWYQSKRVLEGMGMDRLDHHTLRWSINIPTLLFQWLLGTKPAIYYLIPASFGALATLFAFTISRSIAGLGAGVFSAFLFAVTPQISIAANNLMPAIFSCAYLLGTVYFTLRFVENEKGSHLILAILFMFLAYGSKIPNLFFLPGLIVFIYWRTKTLRPLFLFLSLLLLLFILETIGIALYTGEFAWLGRVHYLSQHMDVMQGEQWAYHISDIWKRWLVLPGYWQSLLMGSLICGTFILFSREKKHRESISLIFFMLLSFSFISTFAITSIDPLRFVQPPIDRYLTVTIPFAIIIICCTLSLISIVLTPAMTIFLCWFWATNNYQSQLKTTWTPAVLRANEYQKTISEHWRNDYALLFKFSKDARLYRAVYLEDDILFKSDGSVERIGRVAPTRFDYPSKLPILFVMSRTKTPVGYLELTRKQAIKSKKNI